MARLLRIFVFACVVVLPCAVLVTEIVLYSQNSLYLNDRWIVQKRMMEMGVMGADEFLLTRTLLAQNLLNLGSYHGYQEVIYRQPVTLGQIEFRFQVEDGSYLDMTYNRDGAGYSGLRLSRREDMPSILFPEYRKGASAVEDLSSDPSHRARLTHRIDPEFLIRANRENRPRDKCDSDHFSFRRRPRWFQGGDQGSKDR
jgi:hypothetical protein